MSGSPVEERQATTIWDSADRNIWARSSRARRSVSSSVSWRSLSVQRRRPARCSSAVTVEKSVRPTSSETPAISPCSAIRSMEKPRISADGQAAGSYSQRHRRSPQRLRLWPSRSWPKPQRLRRCGCFVGMVARETTFGRFSRLPALGLLRESRPMDNALLAQTQPSSGAAASPYAVPPAPMRCRPPTEPPTHTRGPPPRALRIA